MRTCSNDSNEISWSSLCSEARSPEVSSAGIKEACQTFVKTKEKNVEGEVCTTLKLKEYSVILTTSFYGINQKM